MSGIHVQVAEVFKTAKTLRVPGTLPINLNNGNTELTIPQLIDYELIVIE